MIKKKILVAPLDWGLGHATRCIPIIKLLLEEGAEVFVAADKAPYELLIREFPTVKFITFPGIAIEYPKGTMGIGFIFRVIPKMLKQIAIEHAFLEELIEEYGFDIVISDNRYGLYAAKTKTVFITHQVIVKTSPWLAFLSPLIFLMSKHFIQKFDVLWIPDVASKENLSGALSHSFIIPKITRFIGILSRFNAPFSVKREIKYDLCAIISGPEPARTAFYDLILKEIAKTSLRAIVFAGIPGKNSTPIPFANGVIYPHLDTDAMQAAILASSLVVSRSGYSTIMDLATLGVPAIFVPTPGQTEQSYLAARLMKKGVAFSQKQADFDLLAALIAAKAFKGFREIGKIDSVFGDADSLIEAVIEILDDDAPKTV